MAQNLNCPAPAEGCNLINNGGFECGIDFCDPLFPELGNNGSQFPVQHLSHPLAPNAYRVNGIVRNVPDNWFASNSGTPDVAMIFDNPCTTPISNRVSPLFDINGNVRLNPHDNPLRLPNINNRYIHLDGGRQNVEGIYTQLARNLQPNTTYVLSLWVYHDGTSFPLRPIIRYNNVPLPQTLPNSSNTITNQVVQQRTGIYIANVATTLIGNLVRRPNYVEVQTPTREWRQIGFTFTTPANVSAAANIPHFLILERDRSINETESNFYIDDVRLEQVPTQPLVVAKTATLIGTNPETIQYNITVRNPNPTQVTNIFLTDVLSSSLIFVSSPNFAHNNGTLTNRIPRLTAQATTTVSFVAQVAPNTPANAQIENCIQVRNDVACASGDTNLCVTYSRRSDISIRKTANITNACIGDTVLFTITARNENIPGTLPATNINVADNLPAGLSFAGATVIQQPIGANTTFNNSNFVIASLAAQSQVVVRIAAVITAAGVHNNTAILTNATPADDNTANNEATASIRAFQPLTITQSVVAGSIQSNPNRVRLQIQVCSPANNPRGFPINYNLQNVVPAGWTVVSNTFNQGISNGIAVHQGSISRNTCQDIFIELSSNSICDGLENCVTINNGATCSSDDCFTVPITSFPNGANLIVIPATVTTFSDAIAQQLLPPSSATNINLLINGTLLLDNAISGYTFTSSNIIMNTGAEIVVDRNNSIGLFTTTVTGCNTLYRGITLLPSATIKGNGNRIEDAQYALRVGNRAIVSLTNTVFNNNYVGIYVAPAAVANTLQSPLFTALSGNTYSCTRQLLPDYQGQTPAVSASRQGYAGIWLNNVDQFVLGSSNTIFGSPNFTPSFLSNGIIANRCQNIEIFGTLFLNLRLDNGYAPSGTAITLQNPQVINNTFAATPFLEARFNTMRNCVNGITASNFTTVLIQNNDMTGITNIGINLQQGFVANGILVTNNIIEAQRAGIVCTNNNKPQFAQIANNQINVGGINTASGIAGIQVSAANIGTSHPYIIESNTITATRALVGIDLLGISDANVFNNHIMFASFAGNNRTRQGIFLGNCVNVVNSCNRIRSLSTGTGSGRTIGISAAGQSNNNIFSCNNLESLTIGAFFPAVTATQLTGNQFDQNTVGLQITAAGEIGRQTFNGNRWLTTPAGGIEAQHLSPSLTQVQRSIFEIQRGFTPDFMPSPIVVVGPGVTTADWFLDIFTPTFFNNCSNAASNNVPCSTPAIPRPANADLDIADADIINATFSTAEYNDEMTVQQKRNTFHKLDKNPLLRPIGSSENNFYQQLQNTAIADLEAAHDHNITINNVSPAWLSQYQQYGEDINLYTDSLQWIDSCLNAQVTTDPLLLAHRFIISDELQQRITDQANHLQTWLQQCQASGQIGCQQATNITCTNLPEHNAKVTQDIYMQYLSAGMTDFTPTQQQTLLGIAEQCPLSGGAGVYMARALYAMVELRAFDDDCIQPVYRNAMLSTEENIEQNSSVLTAYPNPAHEQLTIQWANALISNSQLDIYNAAGILVQSQILNSGSQQISLSVSDLAAGYYTVRLSSSDAYFAPIKILVVKP